MSEMQQNVLLTETRNDEPSKSSFEASSLKKISSSSEASFHSIWFECTDQTGLTRNKESAFDVRCKMRKRETTTDCTGLSLLALHCHYRL